MVRRVLTTVAAAVILSAASAPTAHALSPGCQTLNNPAYDANAFTTTVFSDLPLIAGEQITAVATPPVSGTSPTGIALSAVDPSGGILFRGGSFPGSVGLTVFLSGTYQLSFGVLGTTGTATWNLSCVLNSAPVAHDDVYGTIGSDRPLVVAAPGVLANDTDADQDSLTASLAEDASHGTVTLNPDGSFTYTPDEDYVGTDTFTYTANDGTTASAPATVTITISAGCGGRRATITGTDANNTLRGTSRSDVIAGLGGKDDIDGGSENDIICGGSGADHLVGGSGADIVYGGAGDDSSEGGSGDDVLRGAGGNDLLDGGNDDDRLFGDAGIDRLFGGGDEDRLDGGADAPDRCDGQGGTDTATAACEQTVSVS